MNNEQIAKKEQMVKSGFIMLLKTTAIIGKVLLLVLAVLATVGKAAK